MAYRHFSERFLECVEELCLYIVHISSLFYPLHIFGLDGAVGLHYNLLGYKCIRIGLAEIMYKPVITPPFLSFLFRQSCIDLRGRKSISEYGIFTDDGVIHQFLFLNLLRPDFLGLAMAHPRRCRNNQQQGTYVNIYAGPSVFHIPAKLANRPISAKFMLLVYLVLTVSRIFSPKLD